MDPETRIANHVYDLIHEEAEAEHERRRRVRDNAGIPLDTFPDSDRPSCLSPKQAVAGGGRSIAHIGPAAVSPTVAALYVETGGAYFDLPGVDAWDEPRDARLYAGPHPVVAHPPCQRWGKFWAGQPLAIKLTGIRKVKGDDGGCFAAALAAVRQWGGIIEHPEHSHAWECFGLRKPPRDGGWVAADYLGGGRFGWTCCVEQGRYGHHARKPTWLYVVDCDRPELRWGRTEITLDPAIVARIGIERAKRRGEVASKGGGTDSAPRIGTPPAFRDLLLSIARSARPFNDTSGQVTECLTAPASFDGPFHSSEVTDA